jgi:hypothetical protein
LEKYFPDQSSVAWLIGTTMRKFLTIIARTLAALIAIFFVITTLLSILLTTLNQQLFNADFYKKVLNDQNFYENLPEIIGLYLTNSYQENPCAQNPLACNIDGASPELQACLETNLGLDAYEAIGSGKRNPTETEFQLAQPCLDQYGTLQTGTGNSDGGSEMPAFFQNLTATDWQTVLKILIPADSLKSMTENTLDQLFAYLAGEIDTVSIPLVPLKERLLGTAGSNLIMQLINSQPPCTAEGLVQMVTKSNDSSMLLCRPTEFELSILLPVLQEQLNMVTTKIPDQVVINKPLSPGIPPSESGPFGADPISTLRKVRLIMNLSPLLPLVFLLLMSLFVVRSFKGWLRWWCIPIFVSGLIALGMGIVALLAFNPAWTMFLLPRIPPYIPADIVSIVQELVRSGVQTISGWIIFQSVILFLIGLAGWIGSSFIKAKKTTTNLAS